jgi:aerobic carbon-monoxide dehydrogenase medium subunit
MKPAAFDYVRATDLAQAVALLAASDGMAKAASGTQSLGPMLNLRLAQPTQLVDVSRIPALREFALQGDLLRVGAAVTHAQVEDGQLPDVTRGLLPRVAAGIAYRAVRNRGTIGGSLANNDPAADYPAAVLGLGATVTTDRRSVAADDFFKGLYETALAEGEIITAVSFPIPKKAGWEKFKQPASRFSIVGVFASQGASGVRVAVTGAGACVFRAKALEDKLATNWSPAACEGVKFGTDGLSSDLHGSAEYRAALIPVIAGRAVAGS